MNKYAVGSYGNVSSNSTSRFQITIDVKTIIIGHVFIQTKFCFWGGEETKFCFQ